MEFKNWLETTIRNPDQGIERIVFNTIQSNTIKYRFISNGYNYSVVFSKDDTYGIEAWEISLIGPRGYDLTGMGNFAQVYGHLTQAVKKFIDEYNPKALIFASMESKMHLIYDRFYKKFMQPKYVRVAGHMFVRNDVLPQLNQNTLKLIQQDGESPSDFEDSLKKTRDYYIQRRRDYSL